MQLKRLYLQLGAGGVFVASFGLFLSLGWPISHSAGFSTLLGVGALGSIPRKQEDAEIVLTTGVTKEDLNRFIVTSRNFIKSANTICQISSDASVVEILRQSIVIVEQIVAEAESGSFELVSSSDTFEICLNKMVEIAEKHDQAFLRQDRDPSAKDALLSSKHALHSGYGYLKKLLEQSDWQKSIDFGSDAGSVKILFGDYSQD